VSWEGITPPPLYILDIGVVGPHDSGDYAAAVEVVAEVTPLAAEKVYGRLEIRQVAGIRHM
jgi:hypothetical protein